MQQIVVGHMARRFFAAALASSAIALTAVSPKAAPNQTTPVARVPVVVELFTSEGCSSCPPADNLLTGLATQTLVADAQVITLSEHVDYWDHQGWRDPFSNVDFTVRQTAYAQRGGVGDVYTPEMIVDGETAFIGSDYSAALRAIGKAASTPKPPITLSWASAATPTMTIALDPNPLTAHASVVVAITEDGLRTAVLRGENAGHTLAYTSVTRRLNVVGQTSKDGSFNLELPLKIDGSWNRPAVRVVAFAQTSKHHVVAAGMVGLPNQP